MAILQVVWSHGGAISKDLFDFMPNIVLPSGVELFFVLSGFLIGGILIKEVESKKEFRFIDLLNFWKRRWFRTLPNYYLVLIINILLVYSGVAAGDIGQYNWKFWFFLQNFYSGFYGFFWESWSLSIEEWFYIFIPGLIFLSLLFLRVKRAMLFSILIGLAAPLFYRLYLSDVVYDDFWVGVNISKLVLTRIDSIAFGVLAAYIKFYYPKIWNKSPNLLFGIGICILYLTIAFRGDSNQLFFRTLFFSCYSLGAALLLIKADHINKPRNWYLGSFFTWTSKISYSMYLLHFSVIIALMEGFFSIESTGQKVFFYCLYWILSYLMSYFLYRYFEKPIMNLRDRV